MFRKCGSIVVVKCYITGKFSKDQRQTERRIFSNNFYKYTSIYTPNLKMWPLSLNKKWKSEVKKMG